MGDKQVEGTSFLIKEMETGVKTHGRRRRSSLVTMTRVAILGLGNPKAAVNPVILDLLNSSQVSEVIFPCKPTRDLTLTITNNSNNKNTGKYEELQMNKPIPLK